MTNRIYVPNCGSACGGSGNGTVTVIDGVFNSTTTVSAGNDPYAVAVNPVSDKIYVSNYGSNSVTVIDGATNAASTISVGTFPRPVAVNPVTNKSMWVISLATSRGDRRSHQLDRNGRRRERRSSRGCQPGDPQNLRGEQQQ